MKEWFALAKIVSEILASAKDIAAFIEANKEEAWFKEAAQTWVTLRQAKNPEDKKNAARRIGDIFSRI